MANNKTFRISKLETHHTTALNNLSSTPQTLAQIAPAYGVTQDAAEKHLSLLVDEGLATRTSGSRTTSKYVSV